MKLKNFSMKILDLNIQVTYEKNNMSIHKSDNTISELDQNPNAFVSIIEKIDSTIYKKYIFEYA